jgi:LuxR family maltose regulon positive regulatory protein
VHTVSTHLRRIYAKLQVSDRSSAVHRARELRLLAAGRTPYGRKLDDVNDR